jgi:chromosome segregation ATPase
MTSLEELDQDAHHGNKPNPTRFVEELANEQDYWMSLTDAARVTRSSEPMVRRWVSAGRLPVRKEPAGINQRTRLVRASDVAQIRPIVDPTAAITDDIHKLDLLSIPRQQEQIVRDQRLLTEQIQGIQREIEAQVKPIQATLELHATELRTLAQDWMQRFTAQQTQWQQVLDLHQQRYTGLDVQVEQLKQASEHFRQTLQKLEALQQLAVANLTDQITNDRAAIQTAMQEIQQSLARLDQAIQQQTERLAHDFATRLTQQEVQFQAIFADIKEAIAQQEQERKQVQQTVLDNQEHLHVQQQMLQARIEKVEGIQEQHWSALTHEQFTQYEYMKNMVQRVEALESKRDEWVEAQERIKDQDKKLQWLTMLLQDERAARQVLAEQSTRQQEQLQALYQELERFKTRYDTELLANE